MKQPLYFIAAFLLALIEINIKLKFYYSGVNLMAVTIIGFSLLFLNRNDIGLIILIAGSLVLDIFSPYRFGLYLMTTILSIYIVQRVQTKNNVLDSPVYLVVTSTVLLFITHIFELFANPIWGIFIVSLLLNSTIGLGVLYLLNIFISRQRETIKVSENVHLR